MRELYLALQEMIGSPFRIQVLFICLLPFVLYAQNRFSVSPLEPEAGDRPAARADHATVVVTSLDGYFLLVHGGRNSNGSLNDTWTYIVTSNEWQALTPLDESLPNDPPPPMYGSIGGYRFVEGYNDAFLYITMGTSDGKTKFYNDMWVMELSSFTWRKVKLQGDIPPPRYGAAGGLERFVKQLDEVRAELIVSHGFGENGPLSDTYLCKFNRTDPYQATWRRIHDPVSQYSVNHPHPVHLQAASFTANRDLVMFGGCYSSGSTGGYCPSNAAWMLEMKQDDDEVLTTVIDDEGYDYEWKRISSEPPARVGAAMAQALNSFKGAYNEWGDMAVVYSGSQNTSHTRQILRATAVTHTEIAFYSPPKVLSPSVWIREKVIYVGPPELEHEVLEVRRGSSLSIVRDSVDKKDSDVPNEYYVLLGGQLDNGSFTNALLRISFDAFALPTTVPGSAMFWVRPQVHGVLMFVSFGILNLVAMFISRYCQEKRKRSCLMAVRICIQVIALSLAWTAVRVAKYGRHRKRTAFSHAYIGYIVVVMGTIEPVYAIVEVLVQRRTNKLNYNEENSLSLNMLLLVSKLVRRSITLFVIIFGLVNITLGVLLLTSPLLLWVHWIVYIIVVCIVAFWMEMTQSVQPDSSHESGDGMEPGSIFNRMGPGILKHGTFRARRKSSKAESSSRPPSTVQELFPNSVKSNERFSEISADPDAFDM